MMASQLPPPPPPAPAPNRQVALAGDVDVGELDFLRVEKRVIPETEAHFIAL